MLIPDHETAVDFLNNEAIAKTVVDLLAANRGRALTVGIHGDWGAGKSSVLKMVESALASDQNVACLWFNGWTFQGFDDAKTVMIESIITELCRHRSTSAKVQELGKRLIKRIDWLKLAKRGGGLVFNALTGMPAPGQISDMVEALTSLAQKATDLSAADIKEGIESAADYLKPAGESAKVPEQIHAFREEFRQLLDAANIDQLVVLIDDLDRCLPTPAIETLEAIRLFLFVPKTAFIIGADEGMIEYAVRRHFPDLPVAQGPIPYARNYLEKLIQVPFRIPALGTQETRIYVTLVLIEALMGSDHAGFKKLLGDARDSLSRPWLGTELDAAKIRAVDPSRKAELDAIIVLAQQIGPVLAEGTRGNPRQIKRFLNALMIRQSIAKARGFGDSVNQAVLAKLMLAERFQTGFYEQIAIEAMKAADGVVADLAAEENSTARETGKKGDKAKSTAADDGVGATELGKIADREWLKSWLRIPTKLGSVDLRPYVFVARDKRLVAGAVELGGLDALIERLSGKGLAVQSVTKEVAGLSASDGDTVFSALRERCLGHGNFKSEPPGFQGLKAVARQHVRFQKELAAMMAGLDPSSLGFWIVTDWANVLTDQQARRDFDAVMTKWAAQDQNPGLKQAASRAQSSAGRRAG